MATDYDKPRTTDTDETPEPNVATLTAARLDSGAQLGDDADPLDSAFDLPESDLSGEELTVRLLPRQADEFTCTTCYLVHHRSQLASGSDMVCTDCAA
jgi:hypothetical protein